MIERRAGELRYFQFERLAAYPELIHGISTRADGAGELNVSFTVADDPAAVVAARERVCAALGLSLDDLVVPRQVHETTVAAVERRDRGRGARERETGIPATDGLTTNAPGVALFISAADCVPLLFFDPRRRAIGAAHAGWRGTVAKVAAATVAAMGERYGTNPRELLVGIGPSIGPCCYTVGDDVTRAVRAAFGDAPGLIATAPDGRTRFDLWQANQAALIEAGVPAENVELAALCTACRTELFFSHRAERGRAGRFGAIIALREDHASGDDRGRAG